MLDKKKLLGAFGVVILSALVAGLIVLFYRGRDKEHPHINSNGLSVGPPSGRPAPPEIADGSSTASDDESKWRIDPSFGPDGLEYGEVDTEAVRKLLEANGFSPSEKDMLFRKEMALGELKALVKKCGIRSQLDAGAGSINGNPRCVSKGKLAVVARLQSPTNSWEDDNTVVEVTVNLNVRTDLKFRPGPGKPIPINP
jgi:hypothetical protein